MNHKNRVEMDRKKTKRRKSIAGKRHGRTEEKPTTTEVMNEKEKQDRLEAASALSSLMFLPPKSPKDENGGTDNLGTPSASVTQISVQSTTSGIPTTSQLTSLVHGVGGRGGVVPTSVSENALDLKNKMILTQLQNELNTALKNRNIQPFSNPMLPKHATSKVVSNVPINSKDAKANKRDSQNVPLTVLPQSLTVSKTVAKALRQVVSNNKLKAAETPQSNDSLQKNDLEKNENSEKANSESVSGPLTEDGHEKMECESLPSSRNTDTNLPLKKRRLIGVIDDSLSTADLTLTSSTLNANLDTLNSTRQIENILQMAKDYPITSTNSTVNLNLVSSVTQSKLQAGEGYRPVQFDPRTSLMVLSDLKFVLTPDEDGDLPLHIAVVHENTELVRRFIEIMAISGKTVDRFNKLQQTPLHLAVLVDKPEIIAVLLEAGANPNLLDRNGYTSVHIAVNKQLPACMDTVFRNSKFPVNINTRDYEGYYPLHTCVELNNLKMMMSLIERGADKDCQDGKAGRSVLLYAVEYSRSDIVQYLLNQGANPDIQNYAGVSPMMTAHAASMEDIIGHLNKAIDINEKYDENYIPSKKVPIARIPSKNSQIVNKDSKTGKVVPRDQPLIYHEYESDPDSGFDKIKREPLSRQSSVSSPIDLSMRSKSESPLPPAPELSIRGKPGRRKTKREPKNHKEKLQQKSVLKEKHASVVAALESRMFVDKKYAMKAKAEVAGNDYNEMESFMKSEMLYEDYDKGRTNNENEENVNVDTVLKKFSSVAFRNLILSLKPEETKQLVEKVKEQTNLRSDSASLNLASSLKDMSDSFDKTEHNLEKHQENNTEKMQVDLETDGDSTEKHDFEKDSEPEYPLIMEKNNESVCVIVSEQEKSNEVIGAERMDDDSENLNCDKETMESTVMQVQYESKLKNSVEDNDTEESYEIDEAENIRDPPSQTEGSAKTNSEESETCSNSVQGSEHGVNNANETKKIETQSADNDKQNIVENADTEDKKSAFKDTSCSKIIEDTDSEAMAVGLTPEKTTLNDKYESQSSQDSEGFEVTSSGIESTSPPVLKINKVLENVEQRLNHSESSMEIEDSTMETTEDLQTEDIEKSNLLSTEAKKTSAEEGSKFEPMVEEKESNASIETDEDDNGLVIDEHVSEDESSVNSDQTEKGALNDQEIVNENDKTGFVLGTVPSNESEEVSMEEDINVKEKSDNSDSVSGDKVQNNKINKSVQGNSNELKSKEKSKKGKEKQTAEEKQTDSDLVNSEKYIASPISVVTTSSTVLNNSSSIISLESSQDKEKLSNSETSKVQVETNTTEGILQKGQSHTLYYHDGDGYKPVKIFIDNSEQSSLVLQRMFQTAQLSNLKRQVERVTSGNVKGPDSASETKQLPNLNANLMSLARMGVRVTKDSVPHNDGSIETSGNLANNTALYTSSSTSLTKETIPTTNVVISSLASNSMETTKDLQSFQQAYIDSLKIKTCEGPASNNNTEQTKKRIHSHLTKKPVVQSVSKIESKGKVTSEGTLTRVNPDIRSKLSKALQSPQRKVGIARSDSDTSVVNSRGILSHSLSSVSYTVQTPVTDTRQQL